MTTAWPPCALTGCRHLHPARRERRAHRGGLWLWLSEQRQAAVAWLAGPGWQWCLFHVDVLIASRTPLLLQVEDTKLFVSHRFAKKLIAAKVWHGAAGL